MAKSLKKERHNKILTELKKYGCKTASGLAKECGLSYDATKRCLQELIKKKKVDWIDRRYGGKYYFLTS